MTRWAKPVPVDDATASRSAAEAAQRLSELKAAHRTWRAVGKQLGLGAQNAMLARIAKGTQRPPVSVLLALGIEPPLQLVEVPAGYGVGRACPVCGQVHTTSSCPTKRKPRRKIVGLVTRVLADTVCVKCGMTASADENTRSRAVRTFEEMGWTFTESGPVCPNCRETGEQ